MQKTNIFLSALFLTASCAVAMDRSLALSDYETRNAIREIEAVLNNTPCERPRSIVVFEKHRPTQVYASTDDSHTREMLKIIASQLIRGTTELVGKRIHFSPNRLVRTTDTRVVVLTIRNLTSPMWDASSYETGSTNN